MSKKHNTIYPGVRYREHPKRRYNGKPDRYFSIRYRLHTKLKEEGLGWASEGWNAKKASLTLSSLKEAHVSGSGPQTLCERRKEKEREAQADLTFNEVFLEYYLPHAKRNKKATSCTHEQILFRLKISPVIGDRPLKQIAPVHLERIKKNMSDAGHAPRTIRYALAVVRQVFNFARRNDLFSGDSPTSKVKMPQADNARLRFLTHDEADRLLEALAKNSRDANEMAVISLHSGLRAGEIFSLKWGDVDLERGIMTLRDTKSGRNRPAFMTTEVKQILSEREREGNDDPVFKGRDGKKIKEIPMTYARVVKELGLNEGVTDPRQKVVFHTLRHTYASWMVESGVDLYRVQKLMGHCTIALTERYAHLGDNTLQEAVRFFEKGMKREQPAEIINVNRELCLPGMN